MEDTLRRVAPDEALRKGPRLSSRGAPLSPFSFLLLYSLFIPLLAARASIASICDSERRLSGSKEPRKIILFRQPKESQLRMLDTLASQVHWREQNGYLRLCYKLFRSPRPRNSKEVTRLRLTLTSLIDQQAAV